MADQPNDQAGSESPEGFEATRRIQPLPPAEDDADEPADRTQTIPASRIAPSTSEDRTTESETTDKIDSEGVVLEEPDDAERTAVRRPMPAPPPRPQAPAPDSEDDEAPEPPQEEKTRVGRPLTPEQVLRAEPEVEEPTQKTPLSSIDVDLGRRHPPSDSEQPAVSEEEPTRKTPVSAIDVGDAGLETIADLEAKPGEPARPDSDLAVHPPAAAPPGPKAKPEVEIDLLPGEAEEEPLEQPYSLRRDSTEDSSDSSQAAAPRAGSSIKVLALCLIAGALIGAIVFFAADFANLNVPLPLTGASSSTVTVSAEAWGQGPDSPISFPRLFPPGYLLGFQDNSLHLYDASGADSGYLGSLETENAIPESTRQAHLAGLVGTPQLDGFLIAWPSGNSISWASLSNPALEDKSSLLTPLAHGNLPLTENDEIVFPPVKIEDWRVQELEWFLFAGRRNDKGLLILVEPTRPTLNDQHEPLDPILAPPVSFYDPSEKTSRLLVVTTTAVLLLDVNQGKLSKPDLRNAEARFDEPWPEERNVALRRARFGPDSRGWVLARSDRFAAVQFVPGRGLKLLAEENIDAPDDEQDALAAPAILTFPDSEDPEYDQFLIAPRPGPVHWRIFSGGKLRPPDFKTPKEFSPTDLAAVDLDADGIAEIIGIDEDAKIWMIDSVDGADLTDRLGSATRYPLGSDLSWSLSATPAGDETASLALSALYVSTEGNPVRLTLDSPRTHDADHARGLVQDFLWRESRIPFLSPAR